MEILQFNLEKFSFFVYKAVFLLQKSKISVFSLNFFMRNLTPHCFVLFYPGNNDVMNVGRKVRTCKFDLCFLIYICFSALLITSITYLNAMKVFAPNCY